MYCMYLNNKCALYSVDEKRHIRINRKQIEIEWKKRNKEDDRQEEKNPYYTYIIVCWYFIYSKFHFPSKKKWWPMMIMMKQEKIELRTEKKKISEMYALVRLSSSSFLFILFILFCISWPRMYTVFFSIFFFL